MPHPTPSPRSRAQRGRPCRAPAAAALWRATSPHWSRTSRGSECAVCWLITLGRRGQRSQRAACSRACAGASRQPVAVRPPQPPRRSPQSVHKVHLQLKGALHAIPCRYALFHSLGGRMTQESSTLLATFPRPAKPLELYEFEGCPFCRWVRAGHSRAHQSAAQVRAPWCGAA